MKKDGSVANRVYELFERARTIVERPNHAPSIAAVMVGTMLADITADSELHEWLLLNGVLPFVERAFKRRKGAHGARILSPEQLAFEWPEKLRPIVEALDRDHVFVPSVGEFVPVLPQEISVPQLREAAEFLRGHAKDTLRVAGLLERLADELDAES